MLKPGEVNISKARHPRYRWVAVFSEDGARRKKYFRTKPEAEDFAAERTVRVAEGGNRVVLSDPEISAVKEFRVPLAEAGLSLRSALELALRHHERLNRDGDVPSLIERRLARLKGEGRSAAHLASTRSILRRFGEEFDGRSVASVEVEEIDQYLLDVSERGTPRTVINHRTVIHALFAEGVRLRWADFNVVEGALRPKLTPEEKGILTVDQADRLLRAADDGIVPPLAIALFAGLRVSEIKRLDWADVDLGRGFIRVGFHGKTGKRLVPVTENLAAWLRPVASDRGPVWPANGRKRFESVQRLAGFGSDSDALDSSGLRPWPHNALRHSYGSYWAALHADLPRLADQMGNSAETIQKHYLERVYPDDAERYFGLLPPAPNSPTIPP